MVQKMCTPHNTNAFAMKFAEAVLTTPGMVDGLIERFREGRSWLISWLDANGYPHKGEAGNFIFSLILSGRRNLRLPLCFSLGSHGPCRVGTRESHLVFC